jgi:uncharacterized protein YndB with AHSA1/START domain
MSPETSQTPSTSLHLERTYDATPEEVFDAWTNPEVLRRWWAASPAWRHRCSESSPRLRAVPTGATQTYPQPRQPKEQPDG